MTRPVSRAIGTYLIDVLADLGYVARLRSLSANIQFTYIQNTANRVQASLTQLVRRLPVPGQLPRSASIGCAAFHPNSDSSPNISGFCDPAARRALATRAARNDAAGLAAVDRAVTDAAPAVTLFNPSYIDVVVRADRRLRLPRRRSAG